MGNTCSSVSSVSVTEPVQFTFVNLFPKNNGLDLNKMELVTRIINAQNNWTGNFKLQDSRERAFKWYHAGIKQSNQAEVEEVIRALDTAQVNAKDIEDYGRYMGYEVHLFAELDGGEMSIEPLKDSVI